MYPAIFDEIVVRETVKPTDCAFTSQNATSRPHVFDSGRYAMQAADTVHRRLATVAVTKRASIVHVSKMAFKAIFRSNYAQLGTFRIKVPPMRSATICTASPTDLSWVVVVVSKPMSRIMTVEKELTTPLGIALEKVTSRPAQTSSSAVKLTQQRRK